MTFSFKIDKPRNLQKTFANVKGEVERNGGTLHGNDKQGSIESSGVKGKYVVTNDSIEITITDKPVLFPECAVKNEIIDIFKKCSTIY